MFLREHVKARVLETKVEATLHRDHDAEAST